MPPKKSQKADFIRVRHMLDSSLEALSFIEDKTFEELGRDRMLVLSLIKEIEIIGEAASKVSVNFQKRHPDIPWLAIVATRNRLIHGYFDIDLDIVWQTVKKDLPSLIKELKQVMVHSSSKS